MRIEPANQQLLTVNPDYGPEFAISGTETGLDSKACPMGAAELIEHPGSVKLIGQPAACNIPRHEQRRNVVGGATGYASGGGNEKAKCCSGYRLRSGKRPLLDQRAIAKNDPAAFRKAEGRRDGIGNDKLESESSASAAERG